MAQFGRPSTDTTRDNWVDLADGTTNLYTQLDEVTADDGDYIKTVLTPTSDVYVSKFTSVEDPVSPSGHHVRYHYGKDVTGGDQIDLTVQLREGYVNEGSPGTLIATCGTHTNIAAGWTLNDYTLSGAEANAISDYTSLYIRFVANKP